MSREEIDAAIRRHAEYELLYDKPYEDKRKVRVAGPFTVESLSPHRSLAFAGSAVDATGARNAERDRPIKDEPSGDGCRGDAQFEQTILDNLRTAGIQNGEKDKRIELDMLEPYAATYIQAVGERDGADGDVPRRVGITIGPQYGTVGPGFIKDAAREAIRAGDIDLLCVLGFAFDPQVVGGGDDEYVTAEDGFASVAAERRLGRVPVLLVRMNADLVMGEELKKTGAGNLFTVFGEPDIEIVTEDGRAAGHPARRRRLRPEHRRGPQQRHRPDRALDDRHRLQRRVVLRPPLLLHRWPGPVQAPEDRAQGRHRPGRLGDALRAPSPVPSRGPSRARSPSR